MGISRGKRPTFDLEDFAAAHDMALRAMFRFEEIDGFDARRGLKRCSVPGVGIHTGGATAAADFWRTREGDVVVRCSCSGYRRSLRVVTANGQAVPDQLLPQLVDAMDSILREWVVAGVDDWYLEAY